MIEKTKYNNTKSYKKCIRCGTSVDLFTLVHVFENAHFIGCPTCHTITKPIEKDITNKPVNQT